MAENKRPGLLEQDRADGNKHDTILSQKANPVKANWLEDFRVRHPEIIGTKIIEAVRLLCPGFDKSLLSKCMNPGKYGIKLTNEATEILIDRYERSEEMDRKRYTPVEEPEYPRCPICGAVCETVYTYKGHGAVGCDQCLTAKDAYDFPECFYEEEDEF